MLLESSIMLIMLLEPLIMLLESSIKLLESSIMLLEVLGLFTERAFHRKGYSPNAL